jgi:hypothetical protein
VTRGDVLFDVLQTLCGFAAAYALGFVQSGGGFLYSKSAYGFEWANGAIAAICVASLPFGASQIGSESLRKVRLITKYRLLGAGIAALSLGIVIGFERQGELNCIAIGLLYLCLGGLSWLLWNFGKLRIGEAPSEQTKLVIAQPSATATLAQQPVVQPQDARSNPIGEVF